VKEFGHLFELGLHKELKEEAEKHCRGRCYPFKGTALVYSKHEDMLSDDGLEIIEDLLAATNWDEEIAAVPEEEREHPALNHPSKPLAVVEWNRGLGFVFSTINNPRTVRRPSRKVVTGYPSYLLLYYPTARRSTQLALHYLVPLRKHPSPLEEAYLYFSTRRKKGNEYSVRLVLNDKDLLRSPRYQQEANLLRRITAERFSDTPIKEMKVYMGSVTPNHHDIVAKLIFDKMPEPYHIAKVINTLERLPWILAHRVNLSRWLLEEIGYREDLL